MVCEILSFDKKDSILFEKIEEYAEIYTKEIENDRKEQSKIKDIIKKEYKQSDDIRRQINEIPACDIACDIR
ncbi:MAG: hypothetical protein WC827_04690 [Candidatus Paceibacterota bacterium]|jgi:ferritin